MVLVAVLMSLSVQTSAQEAGLTAFDLNEKAISYLWNDLDSAEQYARFAEEVSGRHSDERAKAVNTLARIATIRMDYTQAWQLYSSVQGITNNMLEVVGAEIGLMRICQRTSDNVQFYEFRNNILLHLRALHEESAALNEAQTERLQSLERSFRMESARYWFELEQLGQAGREMSYVVADNLLRNDHDRYLTYTYMRGLGIGLDAYGLQDQALQRLRSLDNCQRSAVRYNNLRMQALSISAICSLLLEYGTDNVLSGVSEDMLARLNASGVQPELLPTQLALKALQLSASYGGQYEIIECERLLASCYIERGLYREAIGALTTALDMLNDNFRLNSAGQGVFDRLEPYRTDGVIVEQQWMAAMPHAVVPECMASLREQMSLAYSGLDNKVASDYNRTVYLEIQKTIRLDRRFEARTILLERSNRSLMIMLYAVAGAIVLLILFIVLFNKKINTANRRYVEMMQKTVGLCENILRPAPADADIIEWLNSTVSPVLIELTGAQSVLIDENAEIRATWKGKRISRDSKTVLNTVAPYLKAALRNADELVGQEDRLKQAEKQHYLYSLHAAVNKRENLARKTCCQVVAECLPYIDRMRSEIRHLADVPADSVQYEQSLQYVRELAERINQYNDLLSQWIRIRQGVVNLNVESFRVQNLFDIVSHGSRSFGQKGVELEVLSTDAVVRADRVLTLFMINTLADNARKFTPAGGKVTVEAVQGDDYVEISVSDTGVGLSADDVHRILDSKVFDPEKIGNGQSEGKGSGFGLMNCKGIIEKYRKSDDMFNVCRFDVESNPGKGSRFSFRLPKGVKRALMVLLMLCPGLTANSQDTESMGDSLLVKAFDYANQTYMCNLEGRFDEALLYADSAFGALNADYLLNGGYRDMLLTVADTLVPAETYWLEDGYATDYETVLWLRNEIAVSALALRDWSVYRYNDDAYLKLFKLYFGEWKIEDDCRELQRTNSNLYIAVIVFVLIFLSVILVRYVVHSRHWLKFRSDLQQAVRVINSISKVTSSLDMDNFNADDVVSRLADGIYPEMDHLIDIHSLMIRLNDDGRMITAVHSEGPVDERLDDRVSACMVQGQEQSSADGLCRALPLVLTLDGDERLIGVLGVRLEHEPDQTWQVIKGMIAGYMATALYSCVIRFESGFRDIEQIKEESDRIRYEENRLHVSNLILDNCLSTLKHETVWYPNRIVQMVTDIEGTAAGERTAAQVQDMQELVDFYREIFGILSQYALSQISGQLMHRDVFAARELADHAEQFVRKTGGKAGYGGKLSVECEDVTVSADRVMIEYLLDSLLSRGMTDGGDMRLEMTANGGFVRFALHRECTVPDAVALDGLFTPLMNKDDMSYVICRQIIREHDEAFGHPGCRINAETEQGGMVSGLPYHRQE
jgi:signal transduction histidine kinase